MIYKSVVVAVVAVALIALLTGGNVVKRRFVTLGGKRYEVTLYSNDIMEVFREDGLKFSLDQRSGRSTLIVGTRAQLDDALNQLKAEALLNLARAA